MAELDLHDILELEKYDLSGKKGDVSVDILDAGGEFASVLKDVPVEKNLITIAVKKYMDAKGKGGHFVFSVTKNIPSGAGLGGGSSNAAAALRIVSDLFDKDPDRDLLSIASSTGSDVPFFLTGGFAFIEGRGEAVSDTGFYDESYVVLVNNGIHINTGFAYESLKKPVSDIVVNCENRKKLIIERIGNKSGWKDIFKNDFEKSIFGLYPQLAEIKEKMYKNGAFFASMTGSGSTIFGLFKDEHSAVNAQKILEHDGDNVYCTKFRSGKN